MNASKLMRLEVTTIPPEFPVERAHKLMLELGIRHLPVLSGHRLAGIVSDRDVLLGCTRDKNGKLIYPAQTAGEVMSLAPEVASPGVPIAELARTMVESKIDAVPIVSKDNELLGLVTSTDLLLLLTELPEDQQPKLSYQLKRVDSLPARA